MEPAKLPLRDIHLPPDIGWWPPAIGWWLLAIIIPLLLTLAFKLYRRLTKQTAVKSARKLLLTLKQNENLDNLQKLQAISHLIRRVAISTASRNECAGLTGEQWLTYLDRYGTGTQFSKGFGQLLTEAPYRKAPPSTDEVNQFVNLCESWLNSLQKIKR